MTDHSLLCCPSDRLKHMRVPDRTGLISQSNPSRASSALPCPLRTSRLLSPIILVIVAMPDVQPHQAEATTPSHQACEKLLAGVLAAAKAALPHKGLDLLVWGAARLGDQATLRHLLSNGGGSSWTPSKDDDEEWGGDTCLRVASGLGHEGAVKELIDSGVDVDEERRGNGSTPLLMAARDGHEGVVEQLLKAGADVSKARTGNGATPLHIAAQKGHEGIVEQLLKAGADVHKATAVLGVTPLYMAAQQGHEGVVEKLLKAGADVNKARALGQAMEALSFTLLLNSDTRAWL